MTEAEAKLEELLEQIKELAPLLSTEVLLSAARQLQQAAALKSPSSKSRKESESQDER